MRLRVGENCTVIASKERVPNLASVNVLPYADCFSDKEKGLDDSQGLSKKEKKEKREAQMQKTKRTYTEAFITPYFRNYYRPVKKNDQISIKRDGRTIDFIVVDVQPGEYGIVGP